MDAIPNTSYLAQKMFNNHCRGDMLEVRSDALTLDFPGMLVEHQNNLSKVSKKMQRGREDLPVSDCYAFREGDQCHILLINRLFSEPRKVRLSLNSTRNAWLILLV